MQTTEQFMRDYLSTMASLQELLANAFSPIQGRFFVPGYKPFDPMDNVARAKSEAVVSVTTKSDFIEVVTTGYGEHHRMRYSLIPKDQSFLISQMEWNAVCAAGEEIYGQTAGSVAEEDGSYCPLDRGAKDD